MSYRTKINGKQIFGNNECYEEWIDFIKTKGIEIDCDGCYEGEIFDFMEALQIIENITLRIEKERIDRREKILNEFKGKDETKIKEILNDTYGTKSIFDLSHIYNDVINENKDDKFHFSLYDKIAEYLNNGYMFMPYNFYKACEDILENDKPFSKNGHFECFKIKDGEHMIVSAC